MTSKTSKIPQFRRVIFRDNIMKSLDRKDNSVFKRIKMAIQRVNTSEIELKTIIRNSERYFTAYYVRVDLNHNDVKRHVKANLIWDVDGSIRGYHDEIHVDVFNSVDSVIAEIRIGYKNKSHGKFL